MQEQKYIRIKDKDIPINIRNYKTSKYLKMYFKAGEIRPYMLNKYIQCGKILAVNEEDETNKEEDKEVI